MEHEIVCEEVEVAVEGEPAASPMGAYLAQPAAPGSYPGVVIGMEIFGVTGHIRDITERVAGLGYVVIAPDFYHRTAPGIELSRDADGRTRGLELMRRLTRDEALADVDAAMAHLRSFRASADDASKIGMVGFSLGGHIAYLAATQLDLAATAVFFYGGWIPTRDVPLSTPDPTLDLTPGIAARDDYLLFFVGGQDRLITSEQHRQIEEALRKAGVRHEIVVYLDAPHGFFCEEADTFDQASRDDSWQRVRELLARELTPDPTTGNLLTSRSSR